MRDGGIYARNDTAGGAEDAEFADFAPFIMFCNEDPADDPVNPGKDPEDFTMKSDRSARRLKA